MTSERMLTAFVFPPQDAAAEAMAVDILPEPRAPEVFERASEAINYDLFALCTTAPNSEIQKTSLAQPAVVTTSIAHLEVLRIKRETHI